VTVNIENIDATILTSGAQLLCTSTHLFAPSQEHFQTRARNIPQGARNRNQKLPAPKRLKHEEAQTSKRKQKTSGKTFPASSAESEPKNNELLLQKSEPKSNELRKNLKA
jgi:hypothetical protein